MNNGKFLIVVGGATATGKTDLAIRLAQYFDTEILNADSRQVYRELNIGVAKPSPLQLTQARHHFVGESSVNETYNSGIYERAALERLDQIFQERSCAILTGGTGLYIQAVCEGFHEFPSVDPAVRLDLENLYAASGIETLQKELALSDPVYYRQADIYNPMRLIRALEICRSSGAPFSSFQTKEKLDRPFTPLYFNLSLPREVLYGRTNQRVDAMMDSGLLEEARGLLPFKSLNALQTVGYQELFNYFDNLTDLPTAVNLIKQHTRNYAKRQFTWFRKKPHWQTIAPDDFDTVVEICKKSMNL